MDNFTKIISFAQLKIMNLTALKMGTQENELWDVDKHLLAEMRTNSTSREEYNFFQYMQFKQENEVSLSNDLIMSEDDNSDRIYIVRELFDEYVVGCAACPDKEIHVMNLSEALKIHLSEIGFNLGDITLLDWLRSINYKGIAYNHNYDKM